MELWNRYKEQVKRNTLPGSAYKMQGLEFWKNRVFSNIILFIVPVSLIAAVPGIIMSLLNDIIFLAAYDAFAVLVMIFIAFSPVGSLNFRKWLFILTLYLLAVILIYFLGSFGPGLIYLLGVSFFMALIFPAGPAAFSILLNALVCIIFGILIRYSSFEMPTTQSYTIGSWIAVSSNVILLSVCCVVALNMLFNGLESTIRREDELHRKLVIESKETKKVVNALEKKNHELEQFAYITSHDLQEPMITIQSFIGLLTENENKSLSREEIDYLDYITQSSDRMRMLMNGLLQYSLLGRKRIIEKVSLDEVLAESVADLQRTIADSGALIENTPLPVITGNYIEMKLLFVNLLSNAIKYAHPKRKPLIQITAEQKNGIWHFIFRDNGIGISNSNFKKIFIIFQQIHERGKYEGTGIGLAYCKKIVELHEGSIWVDSIPGEGSEFHFTIPVE